MDILEPGLNYRVYYYQNPDKYIDIPFMHKEHKTIKAFVPEVNKVVEDGVVEYKLGVNNEELIYILLDRFKYLNDKHYSKYNDIAIEGVKMIIGAMKDRKKAKQENRERYEETYSSQRFQE